MEYEFGSVTKRVVLYRGENTKIDGYSEPVITGNVTDGFTITNTHEVSKIEIPVTKVWNDDNNRDGLRTPVSVTLIGTVEGKTVRLVPEKDGLYKNVAITVNEPSAKHPLDSNPTLSGYETTMFIDGIRETQDLTVTYSPTNCDENLVVTSSNPSVISVEQKTAPSGGTAVYTLTALSDGSATITVGGSITTQYSATTSSITVATNVLNNIKTSGSMTKTTYTMGEAWDPTGLTVNVNYSDGTSVDVTSDVAWSYNPETTTLAGEGTGKSVTATAT